MEERLHVFFNQNRVGVLSLDEKRAFSFSYTREWILHPESFPLSVSMPLQYEAFPDNSSKAFFANLLPESAVRELVARLLGVSEKNDFMLLKRIGGECAGAITLLPESILPESPDQYHYRVLAEEELAALIENIPRRPLLAGEEGVRISLAGAQQKLALHNIESQFSIPLNGAPSNCILKPGMPDFPATIENECFCMLLANALNLKVPLVKIVEKKAHRALWIERYDRVFNNDTLIRLHQEDFCQAMGLSPELKYQAEGGPGLEACFDLVRRCSVNPVKDIQALLTWAFFNYLIGNMDAHAKNLSFLYRRKQIRLAPFYDLLCTEVYDGLTKKMAMKIGKENRPEWIMKRHWERLAADINIRPVTLKTYLTDFCHKMNDRIETTCKDFFNTYGPNEIVQRITERIKKRSNETLDKLG